MPPKDTHKDAYVVVSVDYSHERVNMVSGPYETEEYANEVAAVAAGQTMNNSVVRHVVMKVDPA